MLDYQAAVALVVAEESLLLIRRAEHPKDPWSGHWALPGGRVEALDGNDPIQTAVREAHEETAIQLNPQQGRLLATAEAGAAVGRKLTVAPAIWYETKQAATTPCVDEVAACKWVPLSEIPRHDDGLAQAALSSLTPQTFPYLNIDGGPLWGFTLRLLQRCWREDVFTGPPIR